MATASNHQSHPQPSIWRSSRLSLSPLQQSDLPFLQAVFSDSPTLRFYLPTLWRTFTPEQTAALLADWNNGESDMVLTIRQLSDQRILGLLNIDEIDWTARNAEIGLALLTDARGYGYAEEALRLLINYLFNEWGFHRVYARIQADNQPSLHLFSKLGFKPEGRLREQLRRQGQMVDLTFWGLLENEWTLT
ncbi:MAG: GNAT family protein [Oscillospiraceae bacterium]|nr:GNAT family protein [Oscillospiraceae bacterium]MDD4368417.1 GNAT family protein [Oscillospiraceae bacterium]